MEIKVIQEA